MTTPTFTTPPTMPARTQQPATYITNFNAFLAWLAVFWAEMVAGVTWMALQVGLVADAQTAATSAATDAAAAAAAAIATSAFGARSSSSFSLTTGAKTIILDLAPGETAKTIANSDKWVAIRRSDPNARAVGAISLWDGTDHFTFTIAATSDITGSGGPYTDWVFISEIFAQPGATLADIRAGISAIVAATPKSLADAAGFITLTDASTVAWDVSGGFDAKLTLTANGHTVGAPTNLIDGLTYVLDINPATFTNAWNAIWDFGQALTPTLPPSAWSKVTAQYNAARNKLEAGVWKGA